MNGRMDEWMDQRMNGRIEQPTTTKRTNVTDLVEGRGGPK
jgi:hypothetical protein